jgi:tRNA (uracil-5-)-methyltransferase
VPSLPSKQEELYLYRSINTSVFAPTLRFFAMATPGTVAAPCSSKDLERSANVDNDFEKVPTDPSQQESQASDPAKAGAPAPDAVPKSEGPKGGDGGIVSAPGDSNQHAAGDDAASNIVQVGDGEGSAPTAATGSLPAWDHANRRVVVQNVNRYDDSKKMGKLLKQWVDDIQTSKGVTVRVEKIRKPPKDNWMTVTLSDEAMVEPLVSYINDTRPRTKSGSTLYAKRTTTSNANNEANDQPTSRSNKRIADPDSEHGSSNSKADKRQKLIEESRKPTTEDEVKDAIIPLWRESPDDQRKSKIRNLIKNCAVRIVKECKVRLHQLAKEKSRKSSVPVYSWLQSKTPIRIEEVIPAPSPVRNKVEFTFGYRYLSESSNKVGEGEDINAGDRSVAASGSTEDDKRQYKSIPSVGVCARGWAGGVSLPHSCPNIPREACAIVDIVEDFLKDSPLPVYDTVNHTGVWRTLTLRSSRRTREVMVVILHSPESGGLAEIASPSLYAESFESEKNRLLQCLVSKDLTPAASMESGDENSMKVTSVFFQEFDGVSHPSPDHPVQHAYGKTHLTEKLGDCLFQISPGAFFQVNTEGAEILYQKVMDRVREVAPDPAQTLLFDVCCGTGTIGIACLKAGVVGRVIGVDISAPAIRDAERNVAVNGFGESPETDSDGAETSPRRATFIASRAEEVLGKEISKARETHAGMEFVAVVDPAREGLHGDVCKTLRANNRIRRVVYVSCNPTGTLVRDAGLFCAPPTKRYSGRPFKISSATPVDMFPMTSVRCPLSVPEH